MKLRLLYVVILSWYCKPAFYSWQVKQFCSNVGLIFKNELHDLNCAFKSCFTHCLDCQTFDQFNSDTIIHYSLHNII